MKNPIVVLHESQSHVNFNMDDARRAVNAAFYVTMSPHEWQWEQEQQVLMAQYVLWAHQRLAAIEQLIIHQDLSHT